MSHDAKLFSRAHNIWRSDDIQVLNAGISGRLRGRNGPSFIEKVPETFFCLTVLWSLKKRDELSADSLV